MFHQFKMDSCNLASSQVSRCLPSHFFFALWKCISHAKRSSLSCAAMQRTPGAAPHASSRRSDRVIHVDVILSGVSAESVARTTARLGNRCSWLSAAASCIAMHQLADLASYHMTLLSSSSSCGEAAQNESALRLRCPMRGP